MKKPSNELACQALFLQAAEDGRGKTLFSEDWSKTCQAVLPFVAGVPFPTLYLEFPLSGAPFLAATVLYGKLEPGTRFHTEAAAGTEQVIDWFAGIQRPGICFGYELDGRRNSSSPAAVHFQHRESLHLAEEFLKALGEPAAAQCYLRLAARMPETWSLAYLGMFRSRPGSPLRACGYLSDEERKRCSETPSHLEGTFRQVGFSAYDPQMLGMISAFLAATPVSADFQFDLFPDGRIGDTFAIDADIGLMQHENLKTSFCSGACADIMKLLTSWGAADDRWHLADGIRFSRALPVEDDNGELGNYGLMITPKWIKARWRKGVLQQAKLYCEARAGFIGDEGNVRDVV